MSTFSLYFSGSCIPTNESLFLLARPTLAQTVQDFIITHPVSFPCGRKLEYSEKIQDIQKSVDSWLFSYKSIASSIEPTNLELQGAYTDD
jgi:hypothetical protein